MATMLAGEAGGGQIKRSDHPGPLPARIGWPVVGGEVEDLSLEIGDVGVYEFVTAPLPAPSGFRPILQPEFPWDYFNGGGSPAAPKNPKRSRTHAAALCTDVSSATSSARATTAALPIDAAAA